MVKRTSAPDRGDVVWLDFTPQAGHEQSGRRPGLVLSPLTYNQKSGLMLCCPITDQAKGYPFEVALVAAAGSVTGVALSDQIRSLDWRSRNAVKFASLTPKCVDEVTALVKLLMA